MGEAQMNRRILIIAALAMVLSVAGIASVSTESDGLTVYMVTFDDNGGSGGPDDLHFGPAAEDSHTFTIPDTIPYRYGWEFLYWMGGGSQYDPGDQITLTSDSPTITLRAAWKTATYTYTVTFDLDGGSGGPDDMSYGPTGSTSHEFTCPTTIPTRTNYTFQYWYGTPVGRVDPGDNFTLPSSSPNATLVAIWSYNQPDPDPTYTYSVVFDDNGGSGGPDNLSYGPTTSTSHTFTIPQTIPVRSGFTFMYWMSGGSQYDPGDSITLTSSNNSVTLRAAWVTTTYTYTITFDLDGGTGGPDDMSFGPTSETSHLFTLPDTVPTKAGYTFQYWTSDQLDRPDRLPGQDVLVGKDQPDITFTAVWSEITYTYTLDFNFNGGTGPDGLSYGPTTATSHTFTIPSELPVREGFTFMYYSYNGVQYQPGEDITLTSSDPNVTLFTAWVTTTYTYTIHFELDGGTGGPSDMSFGPTSETSHLFTLPTTTPTKPGYTFQYWTSEQLDRPDRLPGQDVLVGRDQPDITFTAVWQLIVYDYSITFDLNGGTGQFDQMTYGPVPDTTHTFTLPETAPTYEGYEFQGWLSDGNVLYQPGDDVTLPETLPGGQGEREITLTAQWEQLHTYTVHFELGGGSGQFPDLTYSGTETSHIFTLPSKEPTRGGYSFVGWQSDGVAPVIYDPGDSVTLTVTDPSVTLTALWADAATGIYVSITGATSATVGESHTITAVVLPSDVSDRGVTWTVTAGGNLIDYETDDTWRGGTFTYEAKGAGTVTVTAASVADPDAVNTITITITAQPAGGSDVVGIDGILQAIADALFGGSTAIAGVVLFVIVLAVIFAIVREPLPVLVLGIPVMGAFTLLGILSMDVVILLIIVVSVGLALVARNMWRD